MYIVAAIFLTFDVLAVLYLKKKHQLKTLTVMGVFNAWNKEFGLMKR